MNFSEADFDRMISEVEREQEQRLRVYQNMINNHSMTRSCANRRYKSMSMVLDFLRDEKEKRFPLLDLFSGKQDKEENSNG